MLYTPKKIKKGVTVICYGREHYYNTREEALNYFLEAMCFSEGSEQQRYARIVSELKFTNKVIVCDE